VKLPTSFRTGPQKDLPPAPKCYAKNQDWNVNFMPADMGVAGACYDPNPPKGKFCTQNDGPAGVPAGADDQAEK
jgi:hypothetical protein